MTPRATALVLIDLQNAFCDPRGSFQRRFGPLFELAPTLQACRQLHARARADGVCTLFTQLQFAADYSDGGLLVHSLAPAIKDFGGYVAGSWDAALAAAAPQPEPGDVIVGKTRYDPFLHTPLQEMLLQRGIGHLVLAGVLTNVCVEAAARSAFDRDFRVSVARDATTALAAEIKEASLRTLASHYARVVDVSDPSLWTPPL